MSLTPIPPADFTAAIALADHFGAAGLAEANIPASTLELDFAGVSPGDLVTIDVAGGPGGLTPVGSLTFTPSNGLQAFASAEAFNRVTITVSDPGGDLAGELVALGSAAAVPEPGSCGLLALGLAAVCLARRFTRRIGPCRN